MKKIPLFALLFLTGPFISFSQTALYYTINLGTFVDAKREDFQTLHSLGFLYAYKMENNFSQVYLGGYESRDAAADALTKVQKAGYNAAYVQERFLKDGETVTIIQIGTADIRKPVNWEKYSGTAELWGVISGHMLKLVTGPYSTLDEARQVLPALQKQGYKDAFIRNINSVFLVKIGAFETGNQLKQPLINFKWTGERTVPPPANPPAETPPAYDYPATTKPGAPLPSNAQVKSPVQPAVPEYSAPKGPGSEIRSNVKRRAALELQKVLKAENLYAGSLDGYYGTGTAQGYEAALQNNRELFKYRLLVQNSALSGNTASGDALQNAINRLPDDARSEMVLESYNHPLAKAYQAYQSFNVLGPSNEVNTLMNAAIRQAYVNKPVKFMSSFDYRATYAYNELDQLILHLYYIHAAPDIAYSVPCWLSKRHPQETARAAATLSGQGIPTAQIQSCDPFSDWEEIRMLEALAMDMGGQQPNPAKTAEATSARAALYLANKPMSGQSSKEVDSWQNTLWTNINSWGNRDPLHQKLVPAFKILFYQSAIRLEDFFIDKGFGSEEAKSLALATVRTIIGPSMERFQ